MKLVHAVSNLRTFWESYKKTEIDTPFTSETTSLFFGKIAPYISQLRHSSHSLCKDVIIAHDIIAYDQPASESDREKNIFKCLDALCNSSEFRQLPKNSAPAAPAIASELSRLDLYLRHSTSMMIVQPGGFLSSGGYLWSSTVVNF